MKSARPDPDSEKQAIVLVLKSDQDDALPLSFLLARSALQPVFFGNEYELTNWLRHCVDDSTPVLAAIIDTVTFERNGYKLDCKSTLVAHRIPLLIVDLVRHNNDWCRFGGDWQRGLTIYLATGNLLPQLFEQLRRQQQSHDLHGRDLSASGRSMESLHPD